MRKIYLSAALLVAIAPFTPQDPQDAARKAQEEREIAVAGIELAAMDYLDGIYDVKPRYIERSVHPDAVRIGIPRDSEDSPFGTPTKITYDQIFELAGSYNRDGHIPGDAPRAVKILDVLDVTGSARVTTAWGFDYLQLVKVEDEWMIISILWQTFDHSKAPPEFTVDTAMEGAALFASARCTNCHGNAGEGGLRAADLTDGEWAQSSGDLAGIRATIVNGVPREQMKGGFPRPMDAFGNRLSQQEIDALAQYVWSLSHND